MERLLRAHLNLRLPNEVLQEEVALITTPPSVALSTQELRARIFRFQDYLATIPGAEFGDNSFCPLKHSFSGGIYVREIFIPAGTVGTGKIHRHSHPNFLMQGEVTVVTESGGVERLKAPLSMISPAGTKRALIAHTDVVWITIHEVGEERDLEKIMAMIIAPDYAQLTSGQAPTIEQRPR